MKPISTFADLILVFGFALAALVVASVPAFSVTVARPIIGAIAVLFVPGYAFVAALFPQKKTLKDGVRLGLSFGLSIVIVPLLEIGLNYTRWGIRLGPTLVLLVVFTLVCVVIATIRRHQLQSEQRFAVNWPVRHHSDDPESGACRKHVRSNALDRTRYRDHSVGRRSELRLSYTEVQRALY